MNLILMKSGYPPVIIKKSERFRYYARLNQANNGDVRPLIRFIAKCMERTIKELVHQSQIKTNIEQKVPFKDKNFTERNFIEERVIIVE